MGFQSTALLPSVSQSIFKPSKTCITSWRHLPETKLLQAGSWVPESQMILVPVTRYYVHWMILFSFQSLTRCSLILHFLNKKPLSIWSWMWHGTWTGDWGSSALVCAGGWWAPILTDTPFTHTSLLRSSWLFQPPLHQQGLKGSLCSFYTKCIAWSSDAFNLWQQLKGCEVSVERGPEGPRSRRILPKPCWHLGRKEEAEEMRMPLLSSSHSF